MLNKIEKNWLRWYYQNNDKSVLYPSVSTVVGWKDKLFGKWRGYKTSQNAFAGTGIHYQVQKYIFDYFGVGEIGQWPDIDIYWNEEYRRNKLDNSCKMWLRFLANNPDYRPIATELTLLRNKRRKGFAGTLDQYAVINGEYYLIDIKTGKYWESYDLQLAGYYILLSEFTKVDKVAALYLDADIERNPSMNYHLKVYSNQELQHNVNRFEEAIDEYYKSNIIQMIFSNSYH